MARDLTREYVKSESCIAPAHVLFPQLARIVQQYVEEKVAPIAPADRLDLFLSPYYGWAIERLVSSIRPDTAQGETAEVPRYEQSRGPGSTAEVSYWTGKDVREVAKSHVNYVVADTAKWEQQAAYILDTHGRVAAFVKNAGLGFAIPYIHNGQSHDYLPDFLVRFESNPDLTLILETKGFDELADVKAAAAQRWVAAVNADGSFGTWRYEMARRVEEIRQVLDRTG
jgi:type III restriction enzyme